MATWPFRFVHASDLHLEQVPTGLAEVPDHLRELLLESPYRAAERVFDTVVNEQAEFLILAGDVLNPQATGPRGPLFLVAQFQRLAQHKIPVYWAGGLADAPDLWPSWLPLPENVHVFPRGRIEEFLHHREGAPLARIMGTSRDRSRTVPAEAFEADPSGLFSIGVAHGAAEAEALQPRRLHYWALGGNHNRNTLAGAPQVAHYPGSPQGREPGETGAHGCTLVQVDEHNQVRTSLVPTDAFRWFQERLTVEPHTTDGDLQTLLRERMHSLVEASPGPALLATWSVDGSGPLTGQLRAGKLAADLLTWLRGEYGFATPPRWSVSLVVEPAAMLPDAWYEQETILGDYLRGLRHYQMNSEERLDLDAYLHPPHAAGSLGPAVAISDPQVRQHVLREAALLGVDLLSPEEPQP